MHSLLKNGYFVTFVNNNSNDQIHLFCGINDTENAICQNCNKPLLRFCLLNLSIPIFQNRGFLIDKLPLLFCWTCNVAQDKFFYKYDKNGFSYVYYKIGGESLDFPYENYPVHFPLKYFLLEPISDSDQNMIDKLNDGTMDECLLRKTRPDLTILRNQIGGRPYLVQNNIDEELNCYICQQPMQLLASIAEDESNGYVFTENNYVQVLYFWCCNCHVVGCFQKCD